MQFICALSLVWTQFGSLCNTAFQFGLNLNSTRLRLHANANESMRDSVYQTTRDTLLQIIILAYALWRAQIKQKNQNKFVDFHFHIINTWPDHLFLIKSHWLGFWRIILLLAAQKDADLLIPSDPLMIYSCSLFHPNLKTVKELTQTDLFQLLVLNWR